MTEAGDVKRQLNHLKDYVRSLISEASPSVDTSHITNEVEELEKRHKQLMQKLEDRCHDLESASEIVTQFNVSSQIVLIVRVIPSVSILNLVVI